MARIANEKTGFASSFPRADSAISTLPLYTSVPIEVQCLMQLRVHLKQVSEKNYACVCGRLLIKICGWFSQKPKLEESSAPAAKRGRRPGRRSIEPPEKKKKPEDSRTECCVCKQGGTNSNLVRYAGKFTIVTKTIMDLVNGALWLVVVYEILECRRTDDVTGKIFALFCPTSCSVLKVVARLFRIEQVSPRK